MYETLQGYRDITEGKNSIANKDWSNVKNGEIHVRSKAWIDMNVLILKGVTIGEGVVVGTGIVAPRGVEPWNVAGGKPVVKIIDIKR